MNKVNILLKGGRVALARDHDGKVILSQDEVDCRCKLKNCTITLLTNRNVDSYTRARIGFGSAVWATSCFRCMVHNKSVGGSESSNHLKGDAMDLIPVNGDLDGLEKEARKHYAFVIRYKNFIHCDCRLTQELQNAP